MPKQRAFCPQSTFFVIFFHAWQNWGSLLFLFSVSRVVICRNSTSDRHQTRVKFNYGWLSSNPIYIISECGFVKKKRYERKEFAFDFKLWVWKIWFWRFFFVLQCFFFFFFATKHLCFMMVVHSLFDNLFGLPFKAPYHDNREATGPCCKLTRSKDNYLR